MKKIIEGWKNVIFTDEEVEAIAKARLEVCNTCDYKKNLAGLEICNECHCPLIAKTRSLDSKCPIGKWGKHIY